MSDLCLLQWFKQTDSCADSWNISYFAADCDSYTCVCTWFLGQSRWLINTQLCSIDSTPLNSVFITLNILLTFLGYQVMERLNEYQFQFLQRNKHNNYITKDLKGTTTATLTQRHISPQVPCVRNFTNTYLS